MGNLAETEKRDREERVIFQSNMARGVRSMLDGFSKARSDMARKGRSDRQAVLVGIRKQVTDLRQETAKTQDEVDVTATAVAAPVTVKAAKPAGVVVGPRRRAKKAGWCAKAGKAKRGRK